MDELPPEDQEVAKQVIVEAVRRMTERQRTCLLLCWLGLTQQEAGYVLGITQDTVSRHFSAALKKVQETAPDYT